MRLLITVILFFFAHNTLASHASTPLIPRHVFFENPEKINVQLSPDGKYISYLAPKNGVLNLWIAERNDISHVKAITNDNKHAVKDYHWAYDGKHILYTKDKDGDENFYLFAHNLKTDKLTQLTSGKGARVQWCARRENKPNEIVIAYNERDNSYSDLYRVSLTDYKKEMIFENHKFWDFILDNNLTPRFGAAYDEKTGQKQYYVLDGAKEELFITYKLEESENNHIIGFDETNTIVYLEDSRTTDTLALKALDLKTDKIKTLYNNPKTDTFPTTSGIEPWKKIQILKVEYDKVTYEVLDKSFAKDIKYLESINGGYFDIASRTIDDKFWLLNYYSDTIPSQYYIYDRDQKKTTFLFSARPELEKYKLLPMEPTVIKSRDGLEMVSYLTLPQNKKANEPAPMILYVHGGPVLREHWGYNSIHQWLASRGYAVLSVNYRGSLGFGKKFNSAGAGQWGLKMHDDLTDAVNWAVDQKIADPKKVCIMGGSYGGYATLVGLAFTPDVFACGVDIVGISNLTTFMKTLPSYWKSVYGIMKARVGDPDTKEGRANLDSRSPVNFADKIKKPLLIAHGMNDARVKRAESDQIVAIMKKHNIPVIYALYEDEGHGFSRPESRLSFYAMTEHFLADILGGKAEAIKDEDFKNAHFLLNGAKGVSPKEAQEVINANLR